MPSQIAGAVLRAANREVTARFYSELGLQLREHQHGGPIHIELGPVDANSVIEIYQASDLFRIDAIMIEVPSIAEALEAVAQLGIMPRSDPKDSNGMKFVYVTDPDGRDVMLIERKLPEAA